MDGRGLFGGHWRAGGAQLDSSGVLDGVLTRFDLKSRAAGFDEPHVGAWLGFPCSVSGRSPATDAARPKEGEGHHQQDGSNDDGRVVHGQEGPESKRSHQGDVDSRQHDAKSAGAAERRGREPLRTGFFLAGFLGQRSAALFTEHVEPCLQEDLTPYS